MEEGNGPVKSFKISVEGALEAAIELHQRGEIEEAVALYGDILTADPGNADASHFLGVARHQLGDSDEAIELLQNSLERAPGNVNAINNLGNIFSEVGELARAEECYRKVLELAPRHTDTLINIAVAQRGLGKAGEALEVIKKAIEIDPEHPLAWHNLGNAYRDLKKFDEALSAYRESERLEPISAKASLEIARILVLIDKKDEAIEVVERVLTREPDNAIAHHMMASLGVADLPDRASDDYVRDTFDSFAGSFDEALARLDYMAPRLVADEVLAFAGDRKLDMLDIGCGTGLCGPLLRPVARRLVGVDLSAPMLAQAKRRRVYDQLAEAELTEYLRQADAQYDAIICVDTLVYFGKIEDAVAAAATRLCAGGCLVFTVERHGEDVSEEAYRLQHHGRYSHSDGYISATVSAAGLELVRLEHIVPRMESGEKVSGALVVARKPQ